MGAYAFALIVILWGPTLPRLWSPQADLVDFGVPIILCEPTASVIGREGLMIDISPFLQVRVVVIGRDLRLLFGEARARPLSAEPGRGNSVAPPLQEAPCPS